MDLQIQKQKMELRKTSNMVHVNSQNEKSQ